MAKLPQYRVFLLRCWKEQGQRVTTPPSWRFTVEDAVTRQRHGFTNLGSLAAFLQSNLDGESKAVDLEQDDE